MCIRDRNDIILKMVDYIILFAPWGVAALMAGLIADFQGDASIFSALAVYALTVVAALFLSLIHIFKATGMEFQEDRLEDDFQKMADVLLRSSSATFMYRDFQSRNVMVKDGEPWLIDFQGGRKGPVYYDVASFLWQAKANYPDSLRKELLVEYIDALRKYQPVDEADVYKRQVSNGCGRCSE